MKAEGVTVRLVAGTEDGDVTPDAPGSTMAPRAPDRERVEDVRCEHFNSLRADRVDGRDA